MRRCASLLSAAFMVAGALLMTGCGGPTVPDVVGMRQDEAVRVLQEAGYTLGDVSFAATGSVPLGMIAGQQPAAGEEAREDTPVSLQIASRDGSRVLVPAVAGMSQVTAEGVANTLGLVPLVVEQYTADAPVGQVAAQLPDPGAEVAAGSTLVLVLSKGDAPDKADVPDVTGDNESDATGALESAGFSAEVFEVFNAEVGKGRVIAQVPDGGASVLSGSKVQIVVSKGAGTGAAKMPSVEGKREADAVAAIDSAGLEPRQVYQYDADVAKGIVSAQFPDSGATAAKGSEAIIVISRGKEPVDTVAVPDVLGQTTTAAASALGQAGLSVTTQESMEQTGSVGVFYQFPVAGTEVAPGSSVLIVVSAKP